MSLIERLLQHRRAIATELQVGSAAHVVQKDPEASQSGIFLSAAAEGLEQEGDDWSEIDDFAPPAATKKRASKKFRFGLLPILEAAALFFVLTLAGAAFSVWRLQQGPVSLNWARAYLERSLATGEAEEKVAIGSLQARWDDQRRAVQLIASPVDALDEKGARIARADEIRIEFRPEQVLNGRSALSRFESSGGLFSIVLRADGRLEAGFGAPDAVLKRPQKHDPERLAKLLRDVQSAWKGDGPAGGLNTVAIQNASVIFLDERSRRSFISAQTQLNVRRIGSRIAASLNANLTAPSAKSATLNLEFAGATPGPVRLAMKLNSLNPRAFLPPDLAPFMQAIDAPLDVDGQFRLDSEGKIAAITVSASVQPGKLRRGEDVRDLNSAYLAARYDPASDVLLLTRLEADALGSRLEATGALKSPMRIFEAPEQNKFATFQFNAPIVKWTAQPDRYWPSAKVGQLDNLKINGRITGGGNRIMLDSLTAKLDRSAVRVSADARRSHLGNAKGIYSVKTNGSIVGSANIDSVVALWPSELAKGAREWVGKAIEAGSVRDIKLAADISAASIASGRIPDDSLSVSFAFDGAAVRPYDHSFLIESVRGAARLGGDSFRLKAVGNSGSVRFEDGAVDIAHLHPRGSPVVIKTIARGDLAGFALMFDPKVDKEKAARLGGEGALRFSLSRPMLSDVPWEKYIIDARGVFTGVRVENVIGSLPMEGGKFDVTVDRNHLVAKGSARIGGQPANVTWQEALRQGKEPTTQVSLSGNADATILDNFGVPSRASLRGLLGANIVASGDRLQINKGVVSLNLAQTEISPEGLIWRKPAGSPGQFTLSFQRANTHEPMAFSVRALASNALVNAAAVMDADGRLLSADVSQFYIPGAFDFTAKLSRSSAGANFDARGPMIEGRTVLALLFSGKSKRDSKASEQPMRITASFNQVIAGGQQALKALSLTGDMESGYLTRASLKALSQTDKPLTFTMTPEATPGDRKVRLDMGDLGAAARFVLKEGQVRGGYGNMEGRVSRGGDGDVAELKLRGRDFEMRGTPALARILTLGSLRGLADVLNGDGIKFNSMEAPLTFRGGSIAIKEARASGPAIGITVNGALKFDSQTLDLNGVLAPSYGVNSMLGVVPVVGDLLVSRKGEGVFGVTYSMEGPFENARVRVNPLSALTPGILRRIFEPNTPAAQKQTPSEKMN